MRLVRRVHGRALLFGFAIAITWCAVTSSAIAAPIATFTSTETIPVPPASNYQGSGGGDGWDVSLSPTEVFNVFHHGTVTVACHKQSDASACWSPRTITDSSGNPFASASHSATYLDQVSGKLYAWGRSSDATAGVVCIDTTIAATNPNPFCGFTALTAPGEASTGVSTGMLVGSRWYAFNFFSGGNVAGAKNKLLCFDVSTAAPCAGQPFSVSIGAGNVTVGSFPVPATAAIGSRLIIPISLDGADKLACFDAVTQTDCAGSWPVTLGFPHDFAGSPFPLLDGLGNITGFCLSTSSNQCFDLTGASVATPANMASVIGAGTGWNGPAFVLGARVYVPNGNADQVKCYDYSTSASCANFPHSLPGASYMYTVNPDPQRPTCIWVNSDSGGAQIQNFDAYTGGACGQGPIRLLASQLVVPQEQCRPTEYKSLRILQPPRTAYSDGSIAFLDGNGNPIPGAADRPIDANGTVDLTGLNLNTAIGLPQFLITLNGLSGSPGEVIVELTWTATFDETCIGPDTTVAEKPTTLATSLSGGGQSGPSITVPAGTPVTDTATLSGVNAASAGGTVQYTVYSDSSCTTVVNAGASQAITTAGVLPSSAPVTLNTPGTYYLVASYSGDGSNLASMNTCGDEVLTVGPGGPLPGGGCKVTGGGRIGAANGDKATFGGNAHPTSPPKGELQYTDHGPATPLKVKSISVEQISCSADRKQATIKGKATINGTGSYDYTIDVRDPGEPGKNDTYRIRLSNGYDSGEQTLSGGNIQIHKK
jgi:hypothetical protein